LERSLLKAFTLCGQYREKGIATCYFYFCVHCVCGLGLGNAYITSFVDFVNYLNFSM
jgi:hypothetical protein